MLNRRAKVVPVGNTSNATGTATFEEVGPTHNNSENNNKQKINSKFFEVDLNLTSDSIHSNTNTPRTAKRRNSNSSIKSGSSSRRSSISSKSSSSLASSRPFSLTAFLKKNEKMVTLLPFAIVLIGLVSVALGALITKKLLVASTLGSSKEAESYKTWAVSLGVTALNLTVFCTIAVLLGAALAPKLLRLLEHRITSTRATTHEEPKEVAHQAVEETDLPAAASADVDTMKNHDTRLQELLQLQLQQQQQQSENTTQTEDEGQSFMNSEDIDEDAEQFVQDGWEHDIDEPSGLANELHTKLAGTEALAHFTSMLHELNDYFTETMSSNEEQLTQNWKHIRLAVKNILISPQDYEEALRKAVNDSMDEDVLDMLVLKSTPRTPRVPESTSKPSSPRAILPAEEEKKKPESSNLEKGNPVQPNITAQKEGSPTADPLPLPAPLENSKPPLPPTLKSLAPTVPPLALSSLPAPPVSNPVPSATLSNPTSAPTESPAVPSAPLPPPPPPSTLSIPPPPPPPMPPGMKAAAPPAPAPPMPPGMAPPPPPNGLAINLGGSENNIESKFKQKFLASKKKVSTKFIHWTDISKLNIKNTIFTKCNIAEKAVEEQINAEKLQELFSAKQVSSASASASSSVANVGSTPERVSILPHARSYNIAIILKNIKMPFEEIRSAILAMDSKKLNSQQIESLLKILPTKEEMEQLENYLQEHKHEENPTAGLGDPERFFCAIKDIPHLTLRFKCWNFQVNKWSGLLSFIQPAVESLLKASEEIRESTNFTNLLSIVLACGNCLNIQKKCSLGFTMDSLLKLEETKTADNKSNLLEFIVDHTMHQHPALIKSLMEEFKHVATASKVDPVRLSEDLKEIQNGVKLIKSQLDCYEHEKKKQVDTVLSQQDKFYDFMSRFHDKIASIRLKKIMDQYSEMQQKLKEVGSLFAENEKQMQEKPNLLFMTLNQFMNSLKKYEEKLQKKALQPKPAAKKHAPTKRSGPKSPTQHEDNALLKKINAIRKHVLPLSDDEDSEDERRDRMFEDF